MSSTFSLAIVAVAAADAAHAAVLSEELALPLIEGPQDPVKISTADAVLEVDGGALCLRQTGRGAPGPVIVDFGSAALRHRRRAGANELLGRAVGLGKKTPLSILDATAGLGTDSFVLADLGCVMHLFERHPVIARLLRAGINAASLSGDPWLNDVVSRMTLYSADARSSDARAMSDLDVIYLDPMFAVRDKSAAVKKEMALFQRLLGDTADDKDGESLLAWALEQNVARIVVKRAAKAPVLAALKPSHCIKGKAVRYDVHVRRKLE